MAAGDVFFVDVRVRNNGNVVWQASGPEAAFLSVLVADANGNPWPVQPAAGRFSYPVPPGSASSVHAIAVRAPDIPGRYRVWCGVARESEGKTVLESGPVYEASLTVLARNAGHPRAAPVTNRGVSPPFRPAPKR